MIMISRASITILTDHLDLSHFDSHKVMLFEISISVPSHMLTLHDSVWPKKMLLENFGFRSTVSFVG